MTNFASTNLTEIVVVVFTTPIIGVLVWALKKIVVAWLEQQKSISTAFVEHTSKQSVLMDNTAKTLEDLNVTMIKSQKEVTEAITAPLRELAATIKAHAADCKEANEGEKEVLTKICECVKAEK